ncbi:hypothetical protein ACJZ2D_016404 [Fusarium nematophilum]
MTRSQRAGKVRVVSAGAVSKIPIISPQALLDSVLLDAVLARALGNRKSCGRIVSVEEERMKALLAAETWAPRGPGWRKRGPSREGNIRRLTHRVHLDKQGRTQALDGMGRRRRAHNQQSGQSEMQQPEFRVQSPRPDPRAQRNQQASVSFVPSPESQVPLVDDVGSQDHEASHTQTGTPHAARRKAVGGPVVASRWQQNARGEEAHQQEVVAKENHGSATESQGSAPHGQKLVVDWWSTDNGSIAHGGPGGVLMGCVQRVHPSWAVFGARLSGAIAGLSWLLVGRI